MKENNFDSHICSLLSTVEQLRKEALPLPSSPERIALLDASVLLKKEIGDLIIAQYPYRANAYHWDCYAAIAYWQKNNC